MKFLLISLFAVSVWAQLAPPRVGFIQDSHGQVHPLNGLAGNFLVGGAASTGVVSAAFSGSFGLLKSATALTVIDQKGHALAKVAAPPGPALFAFSADGDPALAYFEHTNALRVWDGHRFQPVELDAASLAAKAVLTIAAPNSSLATLIVERDDCLWELGVRIASGRVVSQTGLPGVTAPVLMLASGELVYRDTHGVVLRWPDGSEKHIAAHLPRSLTFNQMAEGWVQVTDLATGRLFALSTQSGRERYYLLPEAR